MESINNTDKYKKGSTLMKSALKKYEQGDIKGGDKDREMANYFFDKKEEIPFTFSEKDDIALYGENKNFGIIYNVFEENVKHILKEKKNYKAIKDIINFIKNNKILKEQFNCYTALKDKKVSQNIEDYLNEAINFLPLFDKKTLINKNTELINLIRKNNLDENIHIDNEQIKLYESIEFFLLNTKNLNNINEYNINKTIIKEHLEKKSLENENLLTENDYNNEVNSIIDKYNKNLNEEEVALLNELNENNGKDVFTKYKNETINFISEQIKNSQNINEKIDWNNILTKVSLKQFEPQHIFEDIIELIHIQNIITE